MVINLTPHVINIPGHDPIPSTGVARAEEVVVASGIIDGIPLTKISFGEVYGLPAEQEGVYYIVSRIVAEAAKARKDLLVPGEQIRDDTGRIVGCKSLSVVG